MFPISGKFRMIALAEPPVKGGDGGGVMSNPEFLSMFLFHHLKPLSLQDEKELVASLVCACVCLFACLCLQTCMA